MRGKITLDFNLPGKTYKDLESIASKSFQVALTVLNRLEEAKYEGIIEIIKITWRYADYGSLRTKERSSEIDFQVVFSPLLSGKFHEKFQVTAHWPVGSKTVSIYGPEEPQRKEKPYLGGLSLPKQTVNTLASAVVEAMKTIIREQQSFYEKAGERLSQSEEKLAPLAKIK